MNKLMKREIQLGKYILGDGKPCFITFEAGPTHSGLESALKLVEEASKAGANAIKFQIFNPEKLVQDKKQLFTYSILVNREKNILKEVQEPLFNILKRRQLSLDQWKIVKKRADDLNLAFFATIGFEEDLIFLRELGCHSVKIASADVDHFPLLRLAAKSKMNVQLDTGNADLKEIKEAILVLEKEGCDSIIIHQCPSGYPADLRSVCLNMIKTLRETFPKYPIAYSDHTPDADMDIAAVSIGANLVEKTITLDRLTPSVEHVFSLEPKDMKSFIKRIRDVEVALGQLNRELSDKQKESRKSIRRSPYLKSPAKLGTKIKNLEVEFRRPGFGISPKKWEELLESNLVLKNDCEANQYLNCDDLI